METKTITYYNSAEMVHNVYKYKNVKIKLTKANLNIKFNKKCLHKQITPKCAQIRIKNNNNNKNSIAAIKTQKLAQIIRIKEEIKYLYSKKAKLNNELYKLHLEIYNTFNFIIAESFIHNINQYTKNIAKEIYKKQQIKIKTLNKKQNLPLPTCKHTFFPRLINNTNIQLTTPEIETLNRGLKFNLPKINKMNIDNEVINAEAAIKTIPTQDSQNETRVIINKKLKQIIKTNGTNTKSQNKFRKHAKNIKNIKQKLTDNNAIITKSDKGNTVVIINQQEYIQKSLDFIKDNNIKIIQSDPTKKYVKEINNAINKTNHLFPNYKKNKN